MKKLNLNKYIEEELKVQFAKFVQELLEEYYDYFEAIEELEFDNYELLVDKTLCFCKYLDFKSIVNLWDEWLVENRNK